MRLLSFCSGSRVTKLDLAECLAYLLHTSICYTSPVNRVFMQKRLRLHMQSTHRRVGQGAELRSECVSVAFVCERVCVGARLASDCLLFYKWADAQPFSWHVGDTRGLSGRCVLCGSYKPLLSKTNEIGLLKGSRGVEVTFQSTLSGALNHTMMHFFFFFFL